MRCLILFLILAVPSSAQVKITYHSSSKQLLAVGAYWSGSASYITTTVPSMPSNYQGAVGEFIFNPTSAAVEMKDAARTLTEKRRGIKRRIWMLRAQRVQADLEADVVESAIIQSEINALILERDAP